MSDRRSPLRLSGFRNLAGAYTINQFGDWIGDVALAILIFDRTGSALATAALFLALRFIPALLGPPLTARVEIIAARKILPSIYLIEGLIFAAIAWLSVHFSLPAVLALGVLDGALSIAAAALTRAATANMLRCDDDLRRGNAILNIGFSLGGALGPALAGLLVTALGAGSALIVDSATFVLVAAIIAVTPGLRIAHGDESGWDARLRSGIHEAASRPGVRNLLIASAIAFMLLTSVTPVEVVYVKRTLGAGDSGYGLFLAAWGAGMVLGSLAFAAARRTGLLVVLIVSTAFGSLGYLGIALATGFAAACVFSAIGGVANGSSGASLITLIQQSVPQHAQAAVMALVGAINRMMPGIGFLLGGVIATIWSPRVTYAVAAAGVLPLIFVALTLPRLGAEALAGERGGGSIESGREPAVATAVAIEDVN